METIRDILRQNVRRLRKLKGWTQHDLAAAAGLSFSGIQDIETGRRVPRQETMALIAQALGCTEADLLKSDNVTPQTDTRTVGEMTQAELVSLIDRRLPQDFSHSANPSPREIRLEQQLQAALSELHEIKNDKDLFRLLTLAKRLDAKHIRSLISTATDLLDLADQSRPSQPARSTRR